MSPSKVPVLIHRTTNYLLTSPPAHTPTVNSPRSMSQPVHQSFRPSLPVRLSVTSSPTHPFADHDNYPFTCPPAHLRSRPYVKQPACSSTISPVHNVCMSAAGPLTHQSDRLPSRLLVCLLTCPPISLSTHPPVHQNVCLFISTHPPVHQAICLFICRHQPTHLPTCKSILPPAIHANFAHRHVQAYVLYFANLGGFSPISGKSDQRDAILEFWPGYFILPSFIVSKGHCFCS